MSEESGKDTRVPDPASGQLLEEFIRDLNGNVFLREFAVSSGRLAVPDGEVEVADTMVLLRKLLLIYQLKERNARADPSPAALQKWFEKKVSGQAVGQVADTLDYFREHGGRVVKNDCGHDVVLATPDTGVSASLIIYRASLEPVFRGPKGRLSTRAEFVHFVEASDYFWMCEVLRTPVEIVEYLGFRESVIREWSSNASAVSEKALVGQFLVDASGPPEERYAAAFEHLIELGDDDDLSFMLQNLGDRVDYRSGDRSETSHYPILQELALLSRTGLSAFKTRLKRCVDTVKSGEFTNPTHFASPGTNCGFLLTPWDPDLGIEEAVYLRTLTQLSKYRFRTERQVGVSVSDVPGGFYVLWCFVEAPHVDDPAMEAALAAEDCPLPPTSTKSVPKYHFGTEGLRELLSPDAE